MGARPRSGAVTRRAAGKVVTILLTGVVAILALAAGIYVQLERTRLDTPEVSALTRVRLPDLEGNIRTIGEWKGKILLVNFWATWCPPCRQEIPGLIRIQEKHAANGVQVVGIAVDQVDKVRPYAAEIGIRYPILIAGIEALDLARQLGNKSGALPFTVVLDRSGKVVKTHLGLLTEADLEALIAPLLG